MRWGGRGDGARLKAGPGCGGIPEAAEVGLGAQLDPSSELSVHAGGTRRPGNCPCGHPPQRRGLSYRPCSETLPWSHFSLLCRGPLAATPCFPLPPCWGKAQQTKKLGGTSSGGHYQVVKGGPELDSGRTGFGFRPWAKAVEGTGGRCDPFVIQNPGGEACAWSWFPKRGRGEQQHGLGSVSRGC